MKSKHVVIKRFTHRPEKLSVLQLLPGHAPSRSDGIGISPGTRAALRSESFEWKRAERNGMQSKRI